MTGVVEIEGEDGFVLPNAHAHVLLDDDSEEAMREAVDRFVPDVERPPAAGFLS